MESSKNKIVELYHSSRQAIKVYAQLFRTGHIRETVQGEHFELISELNIMGDLNHFLIYQKDDKPSYQELLGLLSSDELLLSGFKEVSNGIEKQLRGLQSFPLMFSLLINVLAFVAVYGNGLCPTFHKITELDPSLFSSWSSLWTLLYLIIPFISRKGHAPLQYAMKGVKYLRKILNFFR